MSTTLNRRMTKYLTKRRSGKEVGSHLKRGRRPKPWATILKLILMISMQMMYGSRCCLEVTERVKGPQMSSIRSGFQNTAAAITELIIKRATSVLGLNCKSFRMTEILVIIRHYNSCLT